MKKKILIISAIMLAAFSLAGCQSKTEQETEEQEQQSQEDQRNEDLLSGKHHAEITVKDYGTIKVELDADTAPVTVTNFVDRSE